MRVRRIPAGRLRLLFFALPLALAVAGCETFEKLNPFQENKPPLAGDRRPVFPEGVPGVQYNAPPQQPSNSNIQITPGMGPVDNPDRPSAEPTPEKQAAEQPAARTSARKTAARPAPKSASRKKEDENPWVDQPAAQTAAKQPVARPAPADAAKSTQKIASKTTSKKKKKGEDEDPWADQR
jgi:hypothetical protein